MRTIVIKVTYTGKKYIKCTRYLVTCLVQIASQFGCISIIASCLRAYFFCYRAFEYACYNMFDYWVSGKEKEMGRLRSHHAF